MLSLGPWTEGSHTYLPTNRTVRSVLILHMGWVHVHGKWVPHLDMGQRPMCSQIGGPMLIGPVVNTGSIRPIWCISVDMGRKAHVQGRVGPIYMRPSLYRA